MADVANGQGLHDALVILGAAGLVIPAFARLRLPPVVGFILVGLAIGPSGLGAMVQRHPWVEPLAITDASRIAPFAEIGILMLLFAIGLELSFRRLMAMRRAVFGLGSAQMLGTAFILGAGLITTGLPPLEAAVLAVALAMSSTALAMPLAGTAGAIGGTVLSILLFQDLSLVPLLFLLDAGRSPGEVARVVAQGIAVVAALLLFGRWILPKLFALAARTKNPELFLATSLFVVMVSSLATGSVGLGAVMGALIAGLLIAETDYHAEVEVITAPLRGLALGVFLLTVGMRIDLPLLLRDWPAVLAATAAVLLAKSLIIVGLLVWRGARRSVAVEAGFLLASPSELTLIVLGAGASAGLIGQTDAAFWTVVTALGLTLTPLLAVVGRRLSRRVDPEALQNGRRDTAGVTVIAGFGRIGRLVAEMLGAHGKPYLGVDGDIDTVAAAREAGYRVVYGDVSRGDIVERFALRGAAAAVLTMDDPVLTVRITAAIRAECPELSIVARARDSAHAAQLYNAGATDAVPETLEGSLQMSEAVLVDVGVAVGPVIASIHENRSDLRAAIMAAGELSHEPALGRRR